MSDLQTLETEILGQISAAADEGALENVRVSALGKKGSVSALLATLGKMAPDERKTAGAAINALKDRVSEALSERKTVLKCAALEARLAAVVWIGHLVRTRLQGKIHEQFQLAGMLRRALAAHELKVAIVHRQQQVKLLVVLRDQLARA